MLLDPGNWAVANKIDPVSEALSPGFTSHATAETHACVIGRLPGSVHEVLLERLGLHAATAGTHPLAPRSEVAVSSSRRYQAIDAPMRALGSKIHVGWSTTPPTSS